MGYKPYNPENTTKMAYETRVMYAILVVIFGVIFVIVFLCFVVYCYYKDDERMKDDEE